MLRTRHDGSFAAEGARVPDGTAGISVTLFLASFAAQASVLVLSPILTEVAATFAVTPAAAGQLRAVSGVAAGATALGLAHARCRLELRRLLGAGLGLLAVGSAASAAAPTFLALALSQVVIGAAIGSTLTGAVAAATAWPRERARPTVLSWTLNGGPGAWIVGMPLVGVAASIAWRAAWLAVPLASALTALAALRALRPVPSSPSSAPCRGSVVRLLRRRGVGPWALGELAAYSAWSGTLVFAGALFTQTYGASARTVAAILGLAAVAYVPGNLLARRLADGRSTAPLSLTSGLAAATVLAFGIVASSIVITAVLFAILAFLAGARGFAGSIRGTVLAPDEALGVGSLRAAAIQFGYVVGSVVGGLGLAIGGYPGLAVGLASLFAAAAAATAARVVPAVVGPRGSHAVAQRPILRHRRRRGASVLGLESFWFVFRLIHILAGVAWAGGVFLFVVFIQPSAAAIGPAAGPMMGQLLGARKLVNRFLLLAAITIAAGLVMYVKLAADAGLGDFVSGGYGLALTIGMLAAIAAASIGTFVTRPNVLALMATQRQVADGGEPPTPVQGAEIARRQGTLKVAGRIALALLVVAVATMATASSW